MFAFVRGVDESCGSRLAAQERIVEEAFKRAVRYGHGCQTFSNGAAVCVIGHVSYPFADRWCFWRIFRRSDIFFSSELPGDDPATGLKVRVLYPFLMSASTWALPMYHTNSRRIPPSQLFIESNTTMPANRCPSDRYFNQECFAYKFLKDRCIHCIESISCQESRFAVLDFSGIGMRPKRMNRFARCLFARHYRNVPFTDDE